MYLTTSYTKHSHCTRSEAYTIVKYQCYLCPPCITTKPCIELFMPHFARYVSIVCRQDCIRMQPSWLWALKAKSSHSACRLPSSMNRTILQVSQAYLAAASLHQSHTLLSSSANLPAGTASLLDTTIQVVCRLQKAVGEAAC